MSTVLKVCQLNTLDESLRPQSRIQSYGEQSLTDDELLTLVLGSSTLCKYNHEDLLHMSLKELTSNGLTTTMAIRILALREYSRRLFSPSKDSRLSFTDHLTAASYLNPKLANLDREHLLVLFLSFNKKLIEEKVFSIGTETSSLVDIRAIISHALRINATCMILSHNHPGGAPQPSEADYEVTNRLNNACKTVGMNLLDHIIISNEGFYSFKDRGCIDN